MNLRLSCFIGMSFTALITQVFATPAWQVNTPGVPSYLSYIYGTDFGLIGTPDSAVASNGVVYAIGADNVNTYLVSWSYCSGWYELAQFTSGTAGGSGAPTGAITLCLGNGTLYVAGDFTSFYNVSPYSAGVSNYTFTDIAAYDLNTGEWSGFGYGSGADTNPITALAVDSNQKLYIGTSPNLSGLVAEYPGGGRPAYGPYQETNIVMVYSNSQWVGLGGGLSVYAPYLTGLDIVSAMAASGTDVYIGGELFGGYNGLTFLASTNFIKWDGQEESWVSMSEGTMWGLVAGHGYDNPITSIAVCESNVFIAGDFGTNTYNSAPGPGSGVGIFSTNGTWLYRESLGLCGSGIALAAQNGSMYIGGNFQDFNGCSGTPCNSIAEWTNGEWMTLGSGVQYEGNSGTVTTLAADNASLYVFGIFDTVNGESYTNTPDYPVIVPAGSRWVTGTSTDPCQTNFNFLDINFSESGSPPIEGEAAFGFSADDKWNYFAYSKCGHSAARTNISHMTNIFGYQTDVSISLGPLADMGPTTHSDVPPVLSNNLAYISVTECGEATATVTISNLPSIGLNGVPALYDVYVYGYGGTAPVGGTEYSINGQFTISPSGTNGSGDAVTTLTTSKSVYTVSSWAEGDQYVLFPNVSIGAGTNLTITVADDPDNPYDGWAINGIQIVPYPYYP